MLWNGWYALLPNEHERVGRLLDHWEDEGYRPGGTMGMEQGGLHARGFRDVVREATLRAAAPATCEQVGVLH